jgi:hypothetical protein
MRGKAAKAGGPDQDASNDFADHPRLPKLTSDPTATHGDYQHDRHLKKQKVHGQILSESSSLSFLSRAEPCRVAAENDSRAGRCR